MAQSEPTGTAVHPPLKIRPLASASIASVDAAARLRPGRAALPSVDPKSWKSAGATAGEAEPHRVTECTTGKRFESGAAEHSHAREQLAVRLDGCISWSGARPSGQGDERRELSVVMCGVYVW